MTAIECFAIAAKGLTPPCPLYVRNGSGCEFADRPGAVRQTSPKAGRWSRTVV
jgi:hypothetical protein